MSIYILIRWIFSIQIVTKIRQLSGVSFLRSKEIPASQQYFKVLF